MNDTECEKCNGAIHFKDDADTAKCRTCGSLYEIDENIINEQVVERTYNFVEFQCIHATYTNKCNNKCPASEMYCMEHVSDDNLISAEQSVEYAKDRLQSAEEILEQMRESKKTWLIQKVSGIDEQDNSIWEDSDGED